MLKVTIPIIKKGIGDDKRTLENFIEIAQKHIPAPDFWESDSREQEINHSKVAKTPEQGEIALNKESRYPEIKTTDQGKTEQEKVKKIIYAKIQRQNDSQ